MNSWTVSSEIRTDSSSEMILAALDESPTRLVVNRNACAPKQHVGHCHSNQSNAERLSATTRYTLARSRKDSGSYWFVCAVVEMRWGAASRSSLCSVFSDIRSIR